jgi:hypothetical protein
MNNTPTSLPEDQDDPMMSLYEYLRKPAGPELGKEVAIYAARKHAEVATRDVSTKSYTGLVHLYRKSLLDSYFQFTEAPSED